MAKVIAIGQPINDAERMVIAHLRDRLPDTYTLIHNFELTHYNQSFEIDIALLAPHAIYLIDTKGTRGTITVYGPEWHPQGRRSFRSPLIKLKGHTRTLKGLITDSHRARPELGKIFVDAAVVLPAPDARFIDSAGRDKSYVTTLANTTRFFTDATRLPRWADNRIGSHHKLIIKLLQAEGKPIDGPRKFGNWTEIEQLEGIEDVFTDYRVYNTFAGPKSGTAFLRAYAAKEYPYLTDQAEKERQSALIKNAYLALNKLPIHPNILGVKDFFANELEDTFFLVTFDPAGSALTVHLAEQEKALTYDQKVKIAQDLLSALHHAHSNDVVHRNLSPSSIFVGTDGQTYLTGFDYARSSSDRSQTIAGDISESLDNHYLAPECFGNPSAASSAADVFSAGLILYELFTGKAPFASPTDLNQQKAIFPTPPSAQNHELPEGFDTWLQSLCILSLRDRPSAQTALTQLKALLTKEVPQPSKPTRPEPSISSFEPKELDYRNLGADTRLGHKYVVEKKLGQGTFGAVYKVIDTLGDMPRAIKLILSDRYSVTDRLKKEYRTLLRIPPHPHVVQVIDADFLPGGGLPYIIFEYIDGLDVYEMVKERAFAPADGLRLAKEAASGLVHIHHHKARHCDIKPSNLLWTDEGTKIIDFNVSVLANQTNSLGGGTRKYLPPDLALDRDPTDDDFVDRDLYALGITLYEAITGTYPWTTPEPPAGKTAKDPREHAELKDLAPELVSLMMKLIAPKRCDRFQSAEGLLRQLNDIPYARKLPAPTEPAATLSELRPVSGNTNPFIDYLLTLYSQSHRSNAGTRGLDEVKGTYVNTLLDDALLPAVLEGEFKLVIITGNAGDGKTAFLQKLELYAEERGGTLDHSRGNGCLMKFEGRTYLSNYDGSQDEGEDSNDAVLEAFFAPYAGADNSQWAIPEIRLIAINEGRLIDFLTSREAQFSHLHKVIDRGLKTGQPDSGVALVNLNLRSVVADVPEKEGSILERQIQRLTAPKFWQDCHNCEIADRCYALHNAQTFQDPVAGQKVTERIKTLYQLTHLRNRLHITLRDLRSALSFMLISDRSCKDIKALYKNSGTRADILDSYYFNSWRGGEKPNVDRLISLLKEVDIGAATDARLDRSLDFMAPTAGGKRFTFDQRENYDQDILSSAFTDLPRDYQTIRERDRFQSHRNYVASLRRRFFFEQRTDGWQQMLPYRSASYLLELLQQEALPETALPRVLAAINRGEGLANPERLNGDLAIQVRTVERGTIGSYRIFAKDRFTLSAHDEAHDARFVERMANGLQLSYQGLHGNDANLLIDLDMFEMLERLNDGYRPSIEQTQGYYLSLVVFKNILASAPYQEVLLTTSGHDFYRVSRGEKGQLQLTDLNTDELDASANVENEEATYGTV
ncbi:MAG: protein kinase [Cyanobacteria bacterium P01_D01_bin.1]